MGRNLKQRWPITLLALPRHLVELLDDAGYKTLADLEEATIADLRAIKGVGGSSIMTIRRVLKKLGCHLADDEEFLDEP